MNNINFKIRFKNKTFWITFIPMVLLLIKQVLCIFGIDFDFDKLSEQLVCVVTSIFAILGLLGIVVDPTTTGIGDSAQAQAYDTPHNEMDDICMKEAE